MNLRLELFVNNIEETVGFYRDILDFKVPNYINEDYTSINNGQVTIGIGEMKKLDDNHPLKVSGSHQRKGLGIELVLEVDNVIEFYERVVSKGCRIETELKERPWGLSDFRLVDPDGYYLRITSK